ncbi:hypothetical protein C823_002717 [Eubacterium plexicaudatum ASF492]|nr:hypothetical protein C823_002717 [Eubacterium plexicaudatum ASF492]
MSSITMYVPIPIMDTTPPFLKHGAPNDKYMACSKIPSAGGRKAATPLGLALDSRPKGCYAPKSDGGYKVKICS